MPKIPSSIRWKASGRTLGQGGQATVIEVRDSSGELPGEYALKLLSPNKPSVAYQRFEREVEAIRSLSHPGIISIVDYSIDAACPFYVMNLHPGAVTLKRILGTEHNRFRGDPGKSLMLLSGIMQALSACEERKIVHRDLSPANILILPDDSIKIIDFGLCQISDTDTITLSDEGVGTQNYMAPECESGSQETVDGRADLYSAGKILWSAISNQSAFARESPVFGPKSMKTLFPLNPSTWHLHDIFERSIRHSKNDRWSRPVDAIEEIRHISYVISSGFPALELSEKMCPFCGVGRLGPFSQSHCVFGNPNPHGIVSLQCNNCFICFPRDTTKLKEELQRRASLR